MTISAKELLNTPLNGNITLESVFDIFDGEGQFGLYTGEDGKQYSLGGKPGFYEELTQKIIDTVKNHA